MLAGHTGISSASRMIESYIVYFWLNTYQTGILRWIWSWVGDRVTGRVSPAHCPGCFLVSGDTESIVAQDAPMKNAANWSIVRNIPAEPQLYCKVLWWKFSDCWKLWILSLFESLSQTVGPASSCQSWSVLATARGDSTKWTKRPILEDGVLRKGFDDATCCEELMPRQRLVSDRHPWNWFRQEIFCMHSIDCERVDGSDVASMSLDFGGG